MENKIEKLLNSAIQNCLFRCGSDPDPNYEMLSSATCCLKALKILNLQVEHEEEVLDLLKNNFYGFDFDNEFL